MVETQLCKLSFRKNAGCDETCCTYRPDILFCTVLVARLERFNVWRFSFRATRRSDLFSQIRWTAITAVSCMGCFLFRCLVWAVYTQFPIFFTINLRLPFSTEYFLTADPKCTRLGGYDTPSVHHSVRQVYDTTCQGSTLPKDTLLECTWYLVSIVDAIVCRCTTCCVAACDVLIGTCCLVDAIVRG